MFKYNLKELILIGVMGGVWGFSEMALGSLLHMFKFPLRGLVLSAIGFFVMLSLKRLVPKPGSVIVACFVTMAMRMMLPSQKIAYILIALSVEALGWEILFSFTRKNRFLLTILGGTFTGLFCATFFIIPFHFMGGMPWEKIMMMYRKQAQIFASFLHINANPILVKIVVEVTLSIVLCFFSVITSEKLIRRFRNREVID